MPNSGPHATVNAAALEPNGTAAHNLDDIIERSIARRLGGAQPSVQDTEALIKEAAKTMPRWGVYALWLFGFTGVGGVGSFVATARSIWDLPAQVQKIEQELAAQKVLHAGQQQMLEEVLFVLRGRSVALPTSGPANVGLPHP
jgi:hypothetical protein